jgi:hypothetical protein
VERFRITDVKRTTRRVSPTGKLLHDLKGCVDGGEIFPLRRFLTSGPSLRRYGCPREHAVVGVGKELRIQKRRRDGVPCLGIETEQALGLGRREPKTGHLEVFRADSAQQFCK